MNHYPITIKILNNEIDLDNECWNCDGGRSKKEDDKNPTFWTEEGVCERCKGIGYIPTDFGKSIFDFMIRYRNLCTINILH